MKRILVLIAFSLVLIGADAHDGYPKDSKGCKMTCITADDKFCNSICKGIGGKGECNWGVCWCTGVPNKNDLWDSNNNKCGGK
uniref:Cardiotonic venom polypeptide n=1 Tax=Hottentotta judaicus TaxID=6863 RepID=Q2TSD9_HOTJU|nr:cardiotonic venom polypeptide precursor [Hottentotta judaicus]